MKESEKIKIVVNEMKGLEKEAEIQGKHNEVTPLQVYFKYFRKGFISRLIVSFCMVLLAIKAKLLTLIWTFLLLDGLIGATPTKLGVLKLIGTLVWLFSVIPFVLVVIVTVLFAIYIGGTIYKVFNLINKLVLNWDKTILE